MNTKIKELLNSLSINCKYRGFIVTVAACELLLEDEMLLFAVTHQLYPKVAEICGCNEKTVERNIRTVLYRAWQNSPERLLEIAGYKLNYPPTVTEFLGILLSYLQRQLTTAQK